MYKATIRALIRHSVRRLNAGDASMMLKMAAPDAVIAFPGDNSWSTMFRPVGTGNEQRATHRGIEECQAFADRFTERGVQFAIEDILVNGPPWRTRIGLRVRSFVPSNTPGEPDEYANRAMALLDVKWGRLVAWEDYEDTERVAAWDQRHTQAVGSPGVVG